MESAHHSFSRPDCNSTADVSSFTPRAALSAIPFVSDLCGVDVQWFHENSSQDLPNSEEFTVQMTFGFLVGSENFCKLFWVSWEVLFYMGRIAATELPNLVPQQRIGDYVVIHILHWKRLWSAVFLSHQNFPPWARLYPYLFCKKSLLFLSSTRCHNFGLSEVSIDTVLTWTVYHFARCSIGNSCEELGEYLCGWTF